MNSTELLSIVEYALISTFICCAILLICGIRHSCTKKLQLGDITAAIILVFLSGSRYEVGSDYTRYLQSARFAASRFADLRTLFNMEVLNRYSYEIGFEAMSVLVSRLTRNQYAIFWVVAIILYVPFIYYCRKRTCDSYAALAIFLLFGFWGLSLNIMKQAIAMMLVVCIFEFIKRKQYIFALLFALVSVSFHTTSIVAIIAIIVIHHLQRKLLIPTKKNLNRMIIIGIIARFGTSIIMLLLSRISIFSKYILYLDSENARINRSFIWVGALTETAIVYLILRLAIGHLDELKKRDKHIGEIISIIMIGLPLSIVGISRQLWLANRFAKFFFLFLIILVPAMMGKFSDANSNRRYIFPQKTRIAFWSSMIIWHMIYSVFMLDNNFFKISTYLFQ